MLSPLFDIMFIKTSAAHNYSTRQAGSLYGQHAPTERTQKNLRHYGTKLWNSLHNVVCSVCAISTFKQNLKVYLLSLYFVPLFVHFFLHFVYNLPSSKLYAPCTLHFNYLHSTLFQLTWHWWKCCLNNLGHISSTSAPIVKVDSSICWGFLFISLDINVMYCILKSFSLYNFGNKFVFIHCHFHSLSLSLSLSLCVRCVYFVSTQYGFCMSLKKICISFGSEILRRLRFKSSEQFLKRYPFNVTFASLSPH